MSVAQNRVARRHQPCFEEQLPPRAARCIANKEPQTHHASGLDVCHGPHPHTLQVAQQLLPLPALPLGGHERHDLQRITPAPRKAGRCADSRGGYLVVHHKHHIRLPRLLPSTVPCNHCGALRGGRGGHGPFGRTQSSLVSSLSHALWATGALYIYRCMTAEHAVRTTQQPFCMPILTNDT